MPSFRSKFRWGGTPQVKQQLHPEKCSLVTCLNVDSLPAVIYPVYHSGSTGLNLAQLALQNLFEVKELASKQDPLHSQSPRACWEVGDVQTLLVLMNLWITMDNPSWYTPDLRGSSTANLTNDQMYRFRWFREAAKCILWMSPTPKIPPPYVGTPLAFVMTSCLWEQRKHLKTTGRLGQTWSYLCHLPSIHYIWTYMNKSHHAKCKQMLKVLMDSWRHAQISVASTALHCI